MPSSGSVDFTVTRDDIVTGAMRSIGALGGGMAEAPTSAEMEDGAEALNMLVKQWGAIPDFAPGLKMWSRKRATLFLEPGQASYSLGPSGDNWTASYTETTISVAEAAGQTVLSVTSIAGMTASDYILIELNDGTWHESTINTSGAGTVTINAALASAAAAGRKVRFYTTKARRPMQILTANLRDVDGNDTPLAAMVLEQYEAIPLKTQDGIPSVYYYEQQLGNGVMYFDCEPSDLLDIIKMVYLSPIEDFDSTNDTPDYPQEWFRALKFGLAVDLWPEFKGNQELPKTLVALRDDSLTMARRAYPQRSVSTFEPNRFEPNRRE